ncbi:hypothetical protein EJB05_06552, partial [Eragrostis curvula]
LQILGLQRTEWILPIGRKLTVVGEAHKDDSGKITIRRPENGGPFHVSTSSVDTIVSDLGIRTRYRDALDFFFISLLLEYWKNVFIR